MRIRQRNRIGVHGHRGSRGTHPENTMAGFREAYDAGADFFELDLHLSADDVPMVFHDPVVSDRVCQLARPAPVRLMTAKELREIDCGSISQRSFPDQRPMPGEKIPTFESVLKWLSSDTSDFGVNIEIKMEAVVPEQMPSPELFAAKVVELVKKYKVGAKAIIQSFDFRPLIEVKKLDPSLFLSCLFEREADFIGLALKTGAKAIGPAYQMLQPTLIQRAHQAGLEVLPWTVNDPAAWADLIRAGVDGIITDYPRALLKTLGKPKE